MLSADKLDVGDPEQRAKLLGRHFHGSGGIGLARLWLRKRGGGCRVEGDGAFHLLHGLVNVSVQDRHGAEALQIGERLCAVVCTPTSLWINGPQRDVGKDNHGRAGGERLQV
jgi:hypothetical protein